LPFVIARRILSRMRDPTGTPPANTAAAAVARGEDGGPEIQRLEFVLHVRETAHRSRRVEVEVYEVRTDRRGTLGGSKRYRTAGYSRSYRRPRWLSVDDAALLFRLDIAAEADPLDDTWTLPTDEVGARMLSDLLATGCCHFEALGIDRLVKGPTRRFAPTWAFGDDGTQRLGLGLAPDDDQPNAAVTTLPVVPPFYLDEARAECGPAQMGLDAAGLAAFVAAPALPATGRTAAHEKLGEDLRRHGLPAPVVLRVVTHDTPQFSAVVAVSRVDESVLLQLSFDYDGYRLDGAEDDGVSRVRADDTVAELSRSLGAERASRDRLVALGWVAFDTTASVFGPPPGESIRASIDELRSLQAEGWIVEIDDDLDVDLDLDLGGRTVAIQGWAVDVGQQARHGWFDIALGIDVEGERIDLLPILAHAISTGELTRDRLRLSIPLEVKIGQGRVVELPVERVGQILDVVGDLFDVRDVPPRVHALTLDEMLQWSWVESDLRRRLEALAGPLGRGTPPRIELPKGLRAQLRDYQRDGVAWLQLLGEADAGGVLADDMGLGKTIQALTHILVEKEAGRLDAGALVVAPRSVLRNWEREAARFTPSLRCAVYHGPGRQAVLEAPVDLVITTYALLARDVAVRRRPWHVVVLDEAQAIKNPRAKVTRAASELQAKQRLCMTGTPVENHLGELWSIVGFAMPGLLGDWRSFGRHYRRPVEQRGDAEAMRTLSRRLAPFVLRRTKSEVLSELPAKTEITRHAVLSASERDLYESIRLTMEQRVRDAMSSRGLARSQIVVLQALLKLRQVCCDARLTDLPPGGRPRAGAKLHLLAELLSQLLAEGRRVLVFSQFTSMLTLVTERLDTMGITHAQITGRTRRRQPIIDRFQAGEFPVLLVSLKAGGTGLNLTAADTVIHYDPWWNPAVERQATDRAHRIGQDRPVTVYRLVCEGTVEERMLQLQDRKRRLADAVTAGAEARSSGGLSLEPADVEMLLAPLPR
jgi:superfamily II DNA or RNA helicase